MTGKNMYTLYNSLITVSFLALIVTNCFLFPSSRRSRFNYHEKTESDRFKEVFDQNFPFLSDNYSLIFFIPILLFLYFKAYNKNIYLENFVSIAPFIWVGVLSTSLIVFLYIRNIDDYKRMDPALKSTSPNIGFYLIFIMVSGSLLISLTTILCLNSGLDFSKGEERIVKIYNRDSELEEIRTKKGKKKYKLIYYIYFTPAIGGLDRFQVSESELGKYIKEDRIKLIVKKGFFGMPYISGDKVVIKQNDYIKNEAEKNLPNDFDEFVNSVIKNMVKCPAGSYIMGSKYDSSKHRVTFKKPFYIGKFEVTQKEYFKIIGVNPSFFKGDDLPVENVNWNNAKAYCEVLNNCKKIIPAGYEFNLPTEAQWEYACRAGTDTNLNNGKSFNAKEYYSSNLDEVGWYIGNADKKSHIVGQKKPNAWGIYDMHGNVAEWCRDYYVYPYSGKDEVDPLGPSLKEANSDIHVVRGGGFLGFSYIDPIESCSSFYRSYFQTNFKDACIGFRIVLVSKD